jgi:hypothetical protein
MTCDPPLPSIRFFRLVMACSAPVEKAASLYGVSSRTLRRWCEEAGLGCRVAGGLYRVSLPLLEAWAAGHRREVRAFVAGKPAASAITEAFDLHGALRALADFQTKQLLAIAAKPATATLRATTRAT